MSKKIIFTAVATLAVLFFSCSRQKYDDPADYKVGLSENGKTIITTRYVGKKWRDIYVPPRINGKRVTEIGESTFADTEIAIVTIPDTITKIGAWSFSGNYITQFTIPKKVTEIEVGAFMNNRLSEITIPNSVKKIDYRAFCDNPLTRITIGKNVELGKISGYDTEKEAAWVYYTFEQGYETEFDEVYEANGRKAGTYVLTNGAWTLQK